MAIKTTMYMHTHEKEGYEHTDKLCFACAIRASVYETGHPFIVPREFTDSYINCENCGNRMDGDYKYRRA